MSDMLLSDQEFKRQDLLPGLIIGLVACFLNIIGFFTFYFKAKNSIILSIFKYLCLFESVLYFSQIAIIINFNLLI